MPINNKDKDQDAFFAQKGLAKIGNGTYAKLPFPEDKDITVKFDWLSLALKFGKWLTIVALFAVLEFFIAMAAVDYYTHTEDFYQSINPDVWMSVHGYLPSCMNETTVNITLCDSQNVCYDDGPTRSETRRFCGWAKWIKEG